MPVLFSNNASSTLSSGINSSATSIAVADGAVFPAISNSNYFYVTFEDLANSKREIVKVTARSGNTLTVTRGQDGTSGTAFSSSDRVELRLNAAALNDATSSNTDLLLNSFTGDGSDVTFSLSGASIENNTLVYVDGVYQNKSTYAVSNATPAVVTFSEAPASGAAIEIMVAAIAVTDVGTPSDNTVTTAKIVNGAVTAAKIASVPIAVGITSVVTSSSATATVNTHVYVSVAGRTITLPASPAIGQRVLITVGNFTNTVVGRNGSKIMSLTANMTLDKAYLSIQFIFTDATQGWVMS